MYISVGCLDLEQFAWIYNYEYKINKIYSISPLVTQHLPNIFFFRFLDKEPLHCISFRLCLIRHYTIFAKTEQGIWQKLRTKLTNQLTGRLFGLLHSAQNLSLCCHLGKVYFLVQAVGIINYLLWLSEDAWVSFSSFKKTNIVVYIAVNH